jgi:competence protein ComEA
MTGVFDSLTSTQRWIGAGLVGLGLAVCGAVGSSYLRTPHRIDLGPDQPLPAARGGQASQGEKQGRVVVHVAGAVRKPGLVTLASDRRVKDAIDAAGGAVRGADLGRLNLAERLMDGTQIYVPLVGEELPDSAVSVPRSEASAPTATRMAKNRQALAPNSISINAASAAELDLLPGIGPATAAKIIEYRASRGGFKSVDELLDVKGIGPKKLAQLRPYVRL